MNRARVKLHLSILLLIGTLFYRVKDYVKLTQLKNKRRTKRLRLNYIIIHGDERYVYIITYIHVRKKELSNINKNLKSQ